jgi:predicted HicB family RNase H-like nuclease
MENTIEYKGYIGQFNYEPGDEAFHGIVLGLRDVIHFQGTCVAELKQSLAESVDDYLAWCQEEGVAPEKPYTGRFVVRIAPDLHRSISVRARLAGVSLNQWVAEALARQSSARHAVAAAKATVRVMKPSTAQRSRVWFTTRGYDAATSSKKRSRKNQ